MAKGCTPDRWLHAHHVVSRRFKGTRWDPACGLTACRQCHAWLHLACLDPAAWYREHAPTVDFDALKLRAEAGGKGLDLKLVILDLKRRLA